VAQGPPVGVSPGRGNEFGNPVGSESDLPVAVVDLPVMEPAQQDGVVQAGRAPSAQWVMWWASYQTTGRSQAGNAHPCPAGSGPGAAVR